MNTTSLHLAALAVAVATTASAAVPRVSSTQMTQAANRLVTITYELADGPAVITLDIETNVTGTAEWVSIGGENIQVLSGDVNRRIATDGEHVIKWRPDLSCRKRRRTLGQWRVDQLQCARTVQWKWWCRQRCGNRDGREGYGHRRQLCAERLGPL